MNEMRKLMEVVEPLFENTPKSFLGRLNAMCRQLDVRYKKLDSEQFFVYKKSDPDVGLAITYDANDPENFVWADAMLTRSGKVRVAGSGYDSLDELEYSMTVYFDDDDDDDYDDSDF